VPSACPATSKPVPVWILWGKSFFQFLYPASLAGMTPLPCAICYHPPSTFCLPNMCENLSLLLSFHAVGYHGPFLSLYCDLGRKLR
jgi:hypothetical protein